MRMLREFRVPYLQDGDLQALVQRELGVSAQETLNIRVLKKSLDARHRDRPCWVYTLEVFFEGESLEKVWTAFPQKTWNGAPPLIIGAGPAGLFAAWTFLQHGIFPILLERGARTHERMLKISRYWRHNELDPDSNVCHGEGGAGTFSDGKLMTRIKSPWIPRIMQALVDYGAPPEITYAYNPHVGSNLIREVIRKMCDSLIANGAKLYFNSRVETIEFDKNNISLTLTDQQTVHGTGLILACGHSSRDIFYHLYNQGVNFEAKPFALGLRIEHLQQQINAWQYGDTPLGRELEPAQYKLSTYWDQEEIGVYSFCMCPGGYVIPSSTESDAIVVNGMSNYHRNSRWANAAMVCTIPLQQMAGDHPFRLLDFQKDIEKGVYAASVALNKPGKVPAQRLEDFFARRMGGFNQRSSCLSGVVAADVSRLIPESIFEFISGGLKDFEKNRPGFLNPEAILHAVESRTSSPIRIPRNPETLESISTEGLFPCGEGPGYAGGITSAAVDGVRSALAWIQKYIP